MKLYRCTITGKQPLLLHNDSVEWADEMDAWRTNKNNKAISKAGDDRSPPWRWIGFLHHDGKHIVIPAEMIMPCFMGGGAMVPTGKGKTTFKKQSQTGILPSALSWPLLIDGKAIPVEKILALVGETDFKKHKQVAIDHGFRLHVKRAAISNKKHVRVRPCFDRWGVVPEIGVSDLQITDEVLRDITEMAGNFHGLGDWRPSSPKKPGSHGMFDAVIEQIG
jgi:hypothetical protein